MHKFDYVTDQEKYGAVEDWRSHAEDFLQGKRFSGDCDDYALTCAEVLLEKGADPSDVAIAYGKNELGEGHLVCIYKDWVLDNRNKWPMPWDSLGYDYTGMMYMSKPGTWLKMENKSDD